MLFSAEEDAEKYRGRCLAGEHLADERYRRAAPACARSEELLFITEFYRTVTWSDWLSK